MLQPLARKEFLPNVLGLGDGRDPFWFCYLPSFFPHCLANLSSLPKPGTSKPRQGLFLKQSTDQDLKAGLGIKYHVKASNYLREHCSDSFPRRAFSQAIHGITPEKVPFVKLCLFSFSLSFVSLFFAFIPKSRGRKTVKKRTLEKKINGFNFKNTKTFPVKSKLF